MKQKVLKRLGLLALSGIMVAPNVLGGEILENNSKPIGNEKAYPKLSTKDAGKNPTKQNNAKAIKGSGFFDNLFKTVGVLFALNETHNLIRNLIGNPWFCLGMARKLYKQTEDDLTGIVLHGYKTSKMLLEYFQRKTKEYDIDNQHELEEVSDHYGNRANQPTTPTRPVFQGVLTPLTDDEIDAQYESGKTFAASHPYLALLILKRFDAMLALGIDILTEFVDSSN